jgi:hypothetical protein
LAAEAAPEPLTEIAQLVNQSEGRRAAESVRDRKVAVGCARNGGLAVGHVAAARVFSSCWSNGGTPTQGCAAKAAIDVAATAPTTASTWRGLGHFRAYVWSAVVAYNLALFTRLKPT